VPEPFTVEHFRRYASLLVFDDGEQRSPEDWQLAYAEDVFGGFREAWLVVPEGNGKTTFIAQLTLYAADYADEPWIPVAASSREQAEILYGQASGFIQRTPGMTTRFRAYDGYRKIISYRNGGKGIKIYAADPKTGDGVIPYPFAIVDELHRHEDMKLYRLWKGKLRKRNGQILTISTAGEPGSEFEQTRDAMRTKATDSHRDGSYLRAATSSAVLHEYMVRDDRLCSDMQAVKDANPLSAITTQTLAEDFDSPTLDLGDWKRLKCNRPTRSSRAAVSEADWDRAQTDVRIPDGASIWLGADFAWVDDPTALVPLWMRDQEFRLLGEPIVLTPPRDGTMLDPEDVKDAFRSFHERYTIEYVVADSTRAQDTLAWVERELGVPVVNRDQGPKAAAEEYEAFMEALRGGVSEDRREQREPWLRHTGSSVLRQHTLNAITRRITGDRRVFDRPLHSRTSSKQDMRVIDALKAASMAHAVARSGPGMSVYSDRGVLVV